MQVNKKCIVQVVQQRTNDRRFQYLNVRDCFSLELTDLAEFSLNVDELEFCPNLSMETIPQWSNTLQYTHLNMCPAALEILEDFRED